MNPTFALVRMGLALMIGAALLGNAADDDKDSKETEKLDKVVVSATKTARSLDKVANSVTVLTEEDIAAKGYSTVAEVLQGLPGIDIVRNGGLGTNVSAFIRGADSKNTLLLIDGIPYYDPSSSNRNAMLAHLSVDNIERIEVVRGPQSVMFGSNATAGVINVITKSGKGKPSTSLRAEYGSFETFKGGIRSSGKVNRLAYSASIDFTERKGYSIANDNNGDMPRAGNTDENDGYRSLGYSGKLKYDITDDFDIALTGRYLESETDIDDFAGGSAGDEFIPFTSTPNPNGQHKQYIDREEAAIRADVHNSFADGLFDSRFYASHTDVDRQVFDAAGARFYDYVGKMEQYGWQGDLNLTHHVISVGGEYTREFLESTSQPTENADTRSAWLQDQAEFGNFYMSTGARYDRHDRFGEEVTWRIAPGYNFSDTGTTLKCSFGTGFRSPSLSELFGPWGSDPTLQPEKSEGWDAGFEQKLGEDVSVGATYFMSEYSNLIEYNLSTWNYEQVTGDTDTQGVEAFADWQATSNLGFRVDYTYTDTEADDGSRLARRPLHKTMLSTRYRISDKGSVNLDIHCVGERDTNTGATDKNGQPVDELDAYVLVNLGARYDLTKHFQVFGRIENITDEEYELAWSYGTPERSAYIGFQATY